MSSDISLRTTRHLSLTFLIALTIFLSYKLSIENIVMVHTRNFFFFVLKPSSQGFDKSLVFLLILQEEKGLNVQPFFTNVTIYMDAY